MYPGYTIAPWQASGADGGVAVAHSGGPLLLQAGKVSGRALGGRSFGGLACLRIRNKFNSVSNLFPEAKQPNE